jgi:membrane-associated phospholipid phosphatase
MSIPDTQTDTRPAATESRLGRNRPRQVARTPNRRFIAVAVLAVVAILAGLFGPTAWAKVTGTTPGNTSAKDRIAADPPPPLFPASQVATTASDVAAQQQRAAELISSWVTTHGTKADDKAFVVWLEQVFPAPPASLSSEMPTVIALDKTRTDAGIAAATWLETYGKKDVWKLYAHDQKEVLDPATGKDRKAEEKAVLKMSKQVADDLGTRYGFSAPYVRMPSLRKDHAVASGQKCPCSYPSRHAAAGAASRAVLGTLMPERDAQYRATEAQIDYSRVYMAGHFPSDIRAGALLGNTIGDYFLITHNGIAAGKLK